MTDLIAKLTAASCGSRELSNEVIILCSQWRQMPGIAWEWVNPNGRIVNVTKAPDPTRVLGDAVALKKCRIKIDMHLDTVVEWKSEDGTFWHSVYHADPCIAVCIALVSYYERSAER